VTGSISKSSSGTKTETSSISVSKIQSSSLSISKSRSDTRTVSKSDIRASDSNTRSATRPMSASKSSSPSIEASVSARNPEGSTLSKVPLVSVAESQSRAIQNTQGTRSIPISESLFSALPSIDPSRSPSIIIINSKDQDNPTITDEFGSFTVVDKPTTSESAIYLINVNPPVPEVQEQTQLLSVVINITLIGSSGEVIEFDGKAELELCFTIDSSESLGGACLAYLNETSSRANWVCEDSCLTSSSPNQACGTSSHFTLFAILLGAGIDGHGGCGSDSVNTILCLDYCFSGDSHNFHNTWAIAVDFKVKMKTRRRHRLLNAAANRIVDTERPSETPNDST
jgi:hypothetical protein